MKSERTKSESPEKYTLVEVMGGVATTYATYKVMASDGRICHVRRDVMTRVINE